MIRAILEATRWRLRLVVGLAQWLRVTVKDCQILRPSRTVAATGKDPHDIGGSTMATALFGWARSVASCNLLRTPDAQAQPDSRRYRKKIRTILEAARWRLRVYGREVGEFVPILRTHPSDGRIGSDVAHSNTPARLVVCQTRSDRQLPLPEKSHCCIATEL
jgi:hypothetical protein